jgi:hypothetical protein
MPWGRLWVSEHTTVLAGARVRLLGLLQVFGSNVLPLSKQDKIDGSVSARVKLVYFELLCAPIGQEHREHVAIMCWGPTRTKFDEILVGGGGWRSGEVGHSAYFLFLTINGSL